MTSRDWIKWEGLPEGGPTLDKKVTHVDVMLRNGQLLTKCLVRKTDWKQKESEYDVVRYRIIKQGS